MDSYRPEFPDSFRVATQPEDELRQRLRRRHARIRPTLVLAAAAVGAAGLISAVWPVPSDDSGVPSSSQKLAIQAELDRPVALARTETVPAIPAVTPLPDLKRIEETDTRAVSALSDEP